MKRLFLACATVAAALPAMASDVGVTIGFDQPGLYGRIDIGRVPSPPVLLYPQPVVIAPSPVAVYRQPIYLHVPPGHAKKWSKHCAKYHACGQPVYFVQDGWYRDVYRPVYHSHSHADDKYERKREKEYEKYERKREKEMRKREKEWHKHEKKHHKRHHHDD